MIIEVAMGGVMFSDLTYPLESGDKKPRLLVKTTAKKDLINSNTAIIDITIIYRFENKGSNKIIDVLKSQFRYQITIKYRVTVEELYNKVYLHAMEYFIKSFKEMDVNHDIPTASDLQPLSIDELQVQLTELCENDINFS
jgi:hypothetical protein